MTQAYEILAASRNSTEGMKSAEDVAVSTDQDWGNEATIYSFEDGSVLVASGPQLNAYTGRIYPQYKVEADKETGEWLGDAEFIDYVSRSDWNAKVDTEKVHFDTYEENGQTRAVEVVWVASELEAVQASIKSINAHGLRGAVVFEGVSVNLNTLPRDGQRYYWAASLQYWADAGNDPSVTQYWGDASKVYFDEPVIVENTYYGQRQDRAQIQ